MCVTPNSKPLPWDCAAPPPFTSTASGSKAATLSKAWSAPCWPQPSNKAAWGQRSDDERAATCRGLSFGRLPFPEGKTAASQGLQRTLGQGRTGGGMRSDYQNALKQAQWSFVIAGSDWRHVQQIQAKLEEDLSQSLDAVITSLHQERLL